jgi:hypothetical protein
MRIAVIFLVLGGAGLLAQSPSSGSIQGVVADSQNKPIAGAVVIVSRTFTSHKAATAPYSQSVKTASDGSFVTAGLPPGSYSYCAQVPGDGYVNGCQWGGAMPGITIASGQKHRAAILLDKGSILKVRILDPGHVALEQSHDRKNPPVLIGVRDGRGHFVPVHSTGRDGAGFNYQLTIPFDTPLNLHISAGKLTMSDNAGVSLPASAQASSASQTAFQHTSGDPNPKSFQFTITGVNR